MEQLTILPRDTGENNRAYCHRVLLYNILTLALAPGDALNEIEIAGRLSVSRTPVHEAVTQLKSDYLVDIAPQSGSTVTLISLRNIREGLFLRLHLEPAIYRQLAGNIGKDWLEAMEANLLEAESAIPSETPALAPDGSLDRYIRLDDEFHRLAYMAAQKPTLWEAMRRVCSHHLRVRYLESLLFHNDLAPIGADHRKLYEYLLLGGLPEFDLDAFYETHLSRFKVYISEMLGKYPAYFSKD
ncbi:MAG: GntR family transcriptional regulator [Lachnospiraceae bacterium]|jgi:DNA-binding GntR family transcriptional regulator|nr:GntR family transcriptional regulator [Lachnospiraceae bacterium]